VTRTADELRHAHLTWQAAEAFADHELRSETYWADGYGAQWTIGRPGTNIFLAQIVSALGALVVHGDIDFVRFAYHGSATAYQRLSWMATRQEIDSYVAEKARIGSGRRSIETHDPDIVKARLLELAAQDDREAATFGEDPEPYLERARVFREAVDHVDSEWEFKNFLWDSSLHTDDWAEHDWTVLEPQVYYAHAALQRARFLLNAKYGPTEHPGIQAA